MIGKLITMIIPPRIYTNGAYDVLGHMIGIQRWQKLWGVITKGYFLQYIIDITKETNVYEVGDEVSFPKYHLFWDKSPQFKKGSV